MLRGDAVRAKDGRATLATVAASAGVSVATVSKVVNGRADVAPETRALVEAILRRHDYVRRRPAPARTTAATPRVETLFVGDLNGFSLELMQGLLDSAAELGVSVGVSLRPREHRRPHEFGAWVRDLATAGREALIAITDDLKASDLGALSRARLPLVVIDPLEQPHSQLTSVGSTNFAGGLEATRHLLSLGHRRIAYLGGPATAACNQARQQGFRAAMEAARLHVPDAYVRTGENRFADGLTGGSALLDLPEPPTAVFAGSDETAAGVIEAARVRGLRIPEDLSLVGFDDTQIARYASPPLTTVRQPLREIGVVALRTALRLAAGEKLDSYHVELATELIVRQSTGAAPSG